MDVVPLSKEIPDGPGTICTYLQGLRQKSYSST